MCVNGSLLASPFFPLYISVHLLFYYHKKCVCSLTPILLSAPVSTSHPISFYLPVIFLFSSSSFSFLWLFILRLIKISLSFLKLRNAFDLTHLYTSSSPFFLSLNQLNKLLTMCVGFLFPKSFLSTLQLSFPFLHLFSDHRSCQGFRWSHLMGTTQPVFLLFYLLSPYKTD